MRKRAFTLIELLIVIAIIVILVSMSVPMFKRNQLMAQLARVTTDLNAIKTASIMLYSSTDEWPPTGNNGDGLINSTRINSTNKWSGPYLEEWRNDPWGNAYIMYDHGTYPFRRYVKSLGPDKDDDGDSDEDDIRLLITPNITR